MSERYKSENSHLIFVETPAEATDRILAAVLEHDSLKWGDYDSVAYRSAEGIQEFRSLGTGRNAATANSVQVPCLSLRFFTALQGPALEALIEALYFAHPYEEPVIGFIPMTRTCHTRGMNEDNPNRFWNRETPDWVPPEHR